MSPGHKPSQIERPPNLRHGLYAAKPATLTEEAAEIVDTVMALPHVTAADYFAAERLATLTVSLRRIEAALADGRVENRKRQPRALLDFQRRLRPSIVCHGTTRHSESCGDALKAATSVSWPNRAFASVVKLSVNSPDPLHWTVIVALWPMVAGGVLAGGLVEGGDADAGRANAPDSSATVPTRAIERRLISSSLSQIDRFYHVFTLDINCSHDTVVRLIFWHDVLHETRSGDLAPGFGDFTASVEETTDD